MRLYRKAKHIKMSLESRLVEEVVFENIDYQGSQEGKRRYGPRRCDLMAQITLL